MSERKEEKELSFQEEVIDFLKTLLISMAVVFLCTRLIARPVRVEGSSMYPTLTSGSLGIANVLSVKTGDISRFDIVIIYLSDRKEYLVKRVIGMPGDTVEYRGGTLYINGEASVEPFLDPEYKNSFGGSFTDDFGPVTVKENEYFCLGDNRPSSKDSRYYGAFSKNQILAKGAFIFLPISEFGVKSW